MAIAGAPTPPAGVCAPRPELKPPHYHRGGPWRAARRIAGRERGKVLEGAGGCAPCGMRRLPENPFCEYWR